MSLEATVLLIINYYISICFEISETQSYKRVNILLFVHESILSEATQASGDLIKEALSNKRVFVVIYINCNITYMIYLLSSERPRMNASDSQEEQAVGVRSREYRAAMACFKTGSVEVTGGRILCRTGFLGLKGPSRRH